MTTSDPYLWLEDVSGQESLDWVRKQNAKSQEVLEADQDFQRLEKDLLAILDSDEKIPYVVKRGPHYYNFWTDRDHQRGIWRRTTLAEYRKANPEWETLLDIDALTPRVRAIPLPTLLLVLVRGLIPRMWTCDKSASKIDPTGRTGPYGPFLEKF